MPSREPQDRPDPRTSSRSAPPTAPACGPCREAAGLSGDHPAVCSLPFPDADDHPSGNHKSLESKIPKRKKARPNTWLSCKIKYFLETISADLSGRSAFFTDDTLLDSKLEATSRGASGVTIMVPTAAISVRFKKSVAVEATSICLPPGRKQCPLAARLPRRRLFPARSLAGCRRASISLTSGLSAWRCLVQISSPRRARLGRRLYLVGNLARGQKKTESSV